MRERLPIWLQSLGCPKNRVDTERLAGRLGMPLKVCANIRQSRVALINTCAFIEPAVRESIRAILDAAEDIASLKRKPLLAVAGCLPGRYGVEELRKELPEVDLWLSPDQMDKWPLQLRAALGLAGQDMTDRLLSTGPSYAWLKIAEGCSHNCAFCAIPAIRGPLRSECAAHIAAEARQLLEKGVSELVLVAQDTTSWGRDLSSSLPDLLENHLLPLPGPRWLRILYLYPGGISERLLSLMAAKDSPLLPYLDVPLQHSHPDILSRMGRPFSGNVRKTVEKIRKYLPRAALRTSLIVGYPGETDRHFEDLLAFVKETRFHNLGVFTFYAEEGVPAAAMPNQIPLEVKEERRAELMRVQAEISREILKAEVGERLEVLVDRSLEEQWPGLHAGRVWFQAPEVDGLTYVSGPGVEPGKMLLCDVEDSDIYDLTALA